MDVKYFIFLQVAIYLFGKRTAKFFVAVRARVEQFWMLYDLLLIFLGYPLFCHQHHSLRSYDPFAIIVFSLVLWRRC